MDFPPCFCERMLEFPNTMMNRKHGVALSLLADDMPNTML